MNKSVLFYGLLICSITGPLFGVNDPKSPIMPVTPEQKAHNTPAAPKQNPPAPATPEQKSPIVFENGDKLFESFFDPNTKHKDKPLFWWLTQMVLLAKKEGNTSLDGFFAKMAKACVIQPNQPKTARAPIIADLFATYRAYFSKEFKMRIEKMGIKNVLKILSERAAV